MELDVHADVKEVLSMLEQTQNGLVKKAAARAINKTITTVNAAAARSIKQDVGGKLSISEIKAKLTKTKANPNQLQATLFANGRRLPIIKIDPSSAQDNAGVSYKTARGRTHVPHAFIATMKTGHKGVFKRKSTTRLPIQELHGPSIPKVFRNETVMQQLFNVAKARWINVFSQELRFALSRFR